MFKIPLSGHGCFPCVADVGSWLVCMPPIPHAEQSLLPPCVAGVGSCLVYVPSHVLSGLYYKRHQSLATGIATSGSGLGGAIMPIVFGKLIQIYGWKASLIVVAGLQLHLIVCAALLRSPPVDKACQTRKISDAKALLDRDKPMCKTESAAAVVEDARGVRVQKEITCQEKSAPPEDSKALLVGSESVTTRNGALAVNDECEKLLQVNALGFCPDEHKPISIRERFSACASAKKTFHDHAQILSTQDANHIDPIKDFQQTKTGCFKVHTDGEKMKDTENGNPQAERTDVFLTSDDDIKVLRHIYLFTNVGFDVYFVSSIMWNAAASVVLSFGPEYTSECGISDIDSAWLLTILGLGDFVGGIIGGVIGNIWVRHRRGQYIVANVLFGLCIAAYPFGSTFGEFAAMMLCAGLTFGVVLGLLVVVLIDLIGSHNLGDGLGYIMLSNGIGAFAGPSLAGTFISCHFDELREQVLIITTTKRISVWQNFNRLVGEMGEKIGFDIAFERRKHNV